ncbi:sigma-70 family RNA polymerase sigma factor [Pedobacter frigiditerrae]|uniref:sigma-70 family RNA polymerase sigma factor n=1 Tax=Pedobacter frigiditerrae TaxID=2530452 RepID=UPI00292DCCB6|nr:sigma-70 family RNA polymerase sigma factor [Pedobacter frigiditerrae]
MPTENEDKTLTEQSLLLDPKKWVGEYADYLFKYAFLRVRNDDLARDLVQETFLAALKGLTGFDGRSSERTWLTAILKFKIIDVYRKESSGLNNIKKLTEEESLQDDFFNTDDGHWKKEHTPKPFETGQDPLQAKEFNKVLKLCMQKLPVLWASVFAMKHLDEEKTEVILSELRITSANFWVIIHRTKLSLRACLQKNWL